MSERSIAVWHSDTHAGLKVALMNPETVLFDEDEHGDAVPYHPSLTASQEYLWRLYERNIEKVKEISGKSPILVGHLGDECNGNKYPRLLVSTRLSDQIVMADWNARPWFELPNVKYYRQVVGTEAHNFGEGSSPILLVQILTSRYPGIDISNCYHGLINFKGVTMDVAHHGPGPGSRDWLKGNVARYYLRDVMLRDLKRGQVPPRLVLRGHYHTPVYEYLEDTGCISELYVLPSYSMFGDHALQVTQSKDRICHGLIVFEIEDGKILRTHRLYEELDVRTREEIE